MKKIISCVILLALLFSVSPVGSADIDLSGMSYEELVALKDRINLAMWESDEWEEVVHILNTPKYLNSKLIHIMARRAQVKSGGGYDNGKRLLPHTL